MKTLDEVIKAMEYNTSGLPKGAMNCLFCDKPDCGVRNNALHYLKEYRETKKRLACLDDAEIRGDDTQIINNPALTWDELHTMKGKPVWVELLKGKWWEGWDIITGFDEDNSGFAMCTVRGDDYGNYYYLADLGKTWQAYRRERNDNIRDFDGIA